MRKRKWLILVAAVLVALAAALHVAHWLIFKDAHHVLIYLFGDIAFLPIEILVVAIIVERLVAYHERRTMLRKMNMLIGTFFSEIGTELLGEIAKAAIDSNSVRSGLAVSSGWTKKDFAGARKFAHSLDVELDVAAGRLVRLRDMLGARRDLLVLLLANPNLLEHESFTDLLWSVFHLMEELSARESLDDLPPTDRAHLAGDLKRVYGHLAAEWLDYAQHLQRAYPYIFSVLVRTHPLQDSPSPVVT
jgi:hypothetical protein